MRLSKQSKQLCMKVVDLEKTKSSCNHFGYSPFELLITVEPKISNLEPQPLNVQLVFENGQQSDIENKKNNINLKTSPDSLFINQFGECKFTVQINTYSMFHDNRAFKLVFNLKETATRHIIPCETNIFRVVKHRLEMITQPNHIFYKDDGGKTNNLLNCQIVLKDCNGNIVQNRDIPLNAKLVYENINSVAQPSQKFLNILTQNVKLKKGQCMVHFRIEDVSKNHGKRPFRILYECASNDIQYNDISACATNEIMVKSKKPNKNKKPKNSINSKPKRKRKMKKEQQNTSCSSDEFVDAPLPKKQRIDLSSILPPILLNNKCTEPSINPGILPHIAHRPPLFAAVSKKNNPLISNNNNNNNNNTGGVLGNVFEWCKLASFVLNKLEWTHSGYEYDEATHSIDTHRPIYRCAYCLTYRNNITQGKHENWCQLKIALEKYEIKVKCLQNEWNYEINNKDNGQMSLLVDQNYSNVVNVPPPIVDKNIYVNNNNNNNVMNNVMNNDINFPPIMDRVFSVRRVPSSHGYDAFDKDGKIVGVFDDEGVFVNADQINGQYEPEYEPEYDPSQMLLRNQSNDINLFYNNIQNNIRNSIFDQVNE